MFLFQNYGAVPRSYKMPKLMNKVEGRGNGIRTAIPNMVDIAKALCVHPRCRSHLSCAFLVLLRPSVFVL